MALPRDAEGSAVVHLLGVAELPGGTLRGGATQRVPWQQPAVPAKAEKDLSEIRILDFLLQLGGGFGQILPRLCGRAVKFSENDRSEAPTRFPSWTGGVSRRDGVVD